MLVLSRDKGQSVRVGETIITIFGVKGDRVRMTFDGPSSVPIVRTEIDKRESAKERTGATEGLVIQGAD